MSVYTEDDLKKKFKDLDANSDGWLNYEELRNILLTGRKDLAEKELRLLWRGVDADRNDKIEFDEFVDFIFGKKIKPAKARWQDTFMAYSGTDDTMQLQEFLEVCKDSGLYDDTFDEHLANVVYEIAAGPDGLLEPEDFSKAIAQIAKRKKQKKKDIQNAILQAKGPDSYMVTRQSLTGHAEILLRMTEPMSNMTQRSIEDAEKPEVQTEIIGFPKGAIQGAPVKRRMQRVISHDEGAFEQNVEELADGVITNVEGVMEETVVTVEWQKQATRNEYIVTDDDDGPSCASPTLRVRSMSTIALKKITLMPSPLNALPTSIRPYNVFKNCEEFKMVATEELSDLLGRIQKNVYVAVVQRVKWSHTGGTLTLNDINGEKFDLPVEEKTTAKNLIDQVREARSLDTASSIPGSSILGSPFKVQLFNSTGETLQGKQKVVAALT